MVKSAKKCTQKPAKPKASLSRIEAEFLVQLKLAGLDRCAREYAFHPSRKWRFDFAWPDMKVAVEAEGGIYTLGRHVRPGGYEADCEKYNEAQLLGWRVLRVTDKHVKSGAAIEWLRRAMLLRLSNEDGAPHER